ncbi:MAG: winged helix-turn-helix domain-containing protein [Acidobacteria bacterium]|nr:winged helix-turn-helix domain-containing protein [Acidobacteriota bacterium]
MTDEAASPRVLRFGTFELDLAAGELRKNGRKVRLQDQPFQLLAALVKKPGEVVTREELKDKLWPGDTYVDFDRSLNTAASKLRDALGGSASSPRFIGPKETGT